jgi:DNA-binding NarL/FixJ family response regulator
MQNKTIRVLIVDDHKLIRESWKALLQSEKNFEIVGEADNGTDAIMLSKTLRPDIVLMDINMHPVNGFDATREISNEFPQIKIIGLSLNDQPSYARKLFQMGAKAYVTKHAGPIELLLAIQEVMKGNRYICQDIKNKTTDDFFNF